MNLSKIGCKKRFLTDLYTGRNYHRPAWSIYPPMLNLNGTNEYTLTDRPWSQVVGERVKHYQLQTEFFEVVNSDMVPVANLLTGTQIFAVAMGREPCVVEGNPPYAHAKVFSAEEALKIRAPKVENCRNLMKVFELADALRRELGPDATLSPTDMQSGFDIANIIWDKTDLMCSVIGEPDAVKHLAGECSKLLKEFYAKLKYEFPNLSACHCPGSWVPTEFGIWVSNDECGAISDETFEEFCLPELIELSETFGGLGMHCCANAEHQFKSFQKIPNVYGFNRVSATAGYEPLSDILGGAGGPVFTQAWMEVADIAKLLRYDGGKSRWHFVFWENDPESAQKKLDELEEMWQILSLELR